jgi:hypothetical protein
MAKRLLQSVLCFILCPLLVATQVAAETGPQSSEPATPKAVNIQALPASLVSVNGRKIELVAQEPVSIEAVMTGSPFQFVVDKDVTVEGVTVMHAKTPVTGVIAKINRGSYEKNRDGYLDLQLSESAGGRPVTVRLGGIPPEPVYHSTSGAGWNGAGNPAVTGLKIVLIAVAVILGIVLIRGIGD